MSIYFLDSSAFSVAISKADRRNSFRVVQLFFPGAYGDMLEDLELARITDAPTRALVQQLLKLLEDVTVERDFLLDPSTYHTRSTSSFRVPGTLVENFRFTL